MPQLIGRGDMDNLTTGAAGGAATKPFGSTGAGDGGLHKKGERHDSRRRENPRKFAVC